MYLIYVNKKGTDWLGNNFYEFLFSDTSDDIDGENWDSFPALNKPSPPHIRHVKAVGNLETLLELSLIQESDSFSVWDSVDGVISLAWENIMAYDEYPDVRISFQFGETKESVEKKLASKNLEIKFNEL